MADIGSIISGVLSAARRVTEIVPGLSTASPLIGVGQKLIAIIDDLTDEVDDPRTQAQMQADRRALAEAVSKKAERTADRFD